MMHETRKDAGIQQESWHSLYNASWQGLITPSAFSHPAKFSKGLIFHIVQHALEEGFVQSGAVVLDPFGGVALGALPCLLHRVNWLGIELEEKFVQCGRENIALWSQKYSLTPGYGQALLLQGDSRHLGSLVQGEADCVVASPPWAQNQQEDGRVRDPEHTGLVNHRMAIRVHPRTPGEKLHLMDYAAQSTEGNLAALPPGAVDLALSSPPYADRCSNDNQRTLGRDGLQHGHNEGDGTLYGPSPANLANLAPGAVDACIASPPFGDSDGRKGGSDLYLEDRRRRGLDVNSPSAGGHTKDPYGTTPGQLGTTQGDTFWSAAFEIVSQTFAVLKPGGKPALDGKGIDFCSCK